MYHQRLTNAQESVLIRQINFLTNRGLPPTSRIARNMAEEMIGERVGKNCRKVDVGDLLDSSINGEVCPFMYNDMVRVLTSQAMTAD